MGKRERERERERQVPREGGRGGPRPAPTVFVGIIKSQINVKLCARGQRVVLALQETETHTEREREREREQYTCRTRFIYREKKRTRAMKQVGKKTRLSDMFLILTDSEWS